MTAAEYLQSCEEVGAARNSLWQESHRLKLDFEACVLRPQLQSSITVCRVRCAVKKDKNIIGIFAIKKNIFDTTTVQENSIGRTFNPRPAEGVFDPPPRGFSRTAKKRRHAVHVFLHTLSAIIPDLF